MTQPPNIDEFKEAIRESLEHIDRWLAESGMLVADRPTIAATDFVKYCVQRVSADGSPEGEEPGSFTDYATSQWFRVIHFHVTEWYRERYGAALERQGRALKAASLILNTPFLLCVPPTTTEPGEPGVSFWLCYHDAVRDWEQPLDWMISGPNLKSLPEKEVAKADRLARLIGTQLRAIHIALLSMKGSDDPVVVQLRNGIFPHLERAAESIVTAKLENIKVAHWDMQMACELALKCLAQQRAGEFKETHDLFVLYDGMPSDPLPFPRRELSKLPNWERIAQLRYGGGPEVPLRDAFRSYKAALTVVQGATGALSKAVQMGSAKFHLKRPPWMEEI